MRRNVLRGREEERVARGRDRARAARALEDPHQVCVVDDDVAHVGRLAERRRVAVHDAGPGLEAVDFECFRVVEPPVREPAHREVVRVGDVRGRRLRADLQHVVLLRRNGEDLVRLVRDLPALREGHRELHVRVVEAVVAHHALARARADGQPLDRLQESLRVLRIAGRRRLVPCRPRRSPAAGACHCSGARRTCRDRSAARGPRAARARARRCPGPSASRSRGSSRAGRSPPSRGSARRGGPPRARPRGRSR